MVNGAVLYRFLKDTTYPWSEIFSLPLLHRCLRLEVAEIFKREVFVFAVELSRTLFAPLDDSINVVVDHQTAWTASANQKKYETVSERTRH